MSFIELYAKELVALLVPLLTWGLNRVFRARAKLQLGNPHGFTFLIQKPLVDQDGKIIAPTQMVQTSSFILKNAGSEPAKSIELVFNWKPECINVWPSRQMTEQVQADGRYVLLLPNLAPGEVMGFELLSVNRDLPKLVIARSEQCVAHPIPMQPQPVASAFKVRAVLGLSLAGLGLVVYAALVALQFIILKTPLR